jgi:hypothetical protein
MSLRNFATIRPCCAGQCKPRATASAAAPALTATRSTLRAASTTRRGLLRRDAGADRNDHGKYNHQYLNRFKSHSVSSFGINFSAAENITAGWAVRNGPITRIGFLYYCPDALLPQRITPFAEVLKTFYSVGGGCVSGTSFQRALPHVRSRDIFWDFGEL